MLLLFASTHILAAETTAAQAEEKLLGKLPVVPSPTRMAQPRTNTPGGITAHVDAAIAPQAINGRYWHDKISVLLCRCALTSWRQGF